MDSEQMRTLAKKALAALVDQARNHRGGTKWLTYPELGERIGMPGPYNTNHFGRQIGKVLGEMGHMFDEVKIDGEPIPPIQVLAVKTQERLPSDGLREFYPDYPKLTKEKKRDFCANLYPAIFNFGSRWDKLLAQLDIRPISEGLPPLPAGGRHNRWGSEGSPEHRALRDFVAANPERVGLPAGGSPITEYPLRSGDDIDVYFHYGNELVGVEVKSRRSGPDDLLRGVFQCVKYKALLQAEASVRAELLPVRTVLALEGELDYHSRRAASILSVRVVEKVKVSGA